MIFWVWSMLRRRAASGIEGSRCSSARGIAQPSAGVLKHMHQFGEGGISCYDPMTSRDYKCRVIAIVMPGIQDVTLSES